MASLLKQKTVRYQRPSGTKCLKPEAIVYDDSGEEILKDGYTRTLEDSKNWYGQLTQRDTGGKPRRIALCPDKQASKEMLAKIVVDMVAARVGMPGSSPPDVALQLAECNAIIRDHEQTIKELNSQIATLLNVSRKMEMELASQEAFDITHYTSPELVDRPPVPRPLISRIPHKQDGHPKIPCASGVYFLYSRGIVAYVGKSMKLSGRIHAGHDKGLFSDAASWLLFDPNELDFAECFYIAHCRPYRNFNWNKSMEALDGCRLFVP